MTKKKKKNDENRINIPSILAFERKLEVSDGLMYAGNWSVDETKMEEQTWRSISITSPRYRGTQSSLGTDDKDKTAPNIIEGDKATLFEDTNTLKMVFSLRVLGNLGQPFACNGPGFADEIKQKVNVFKTTEVCTDLAFRYAYNIVSGRFLWKNRVDAKEVKVCVSYMKGDKQESLDFNAYDFSLRNFEKNVDNRNLTKLTQYLSDGLFSNKENQFIFLKVSAYVYLGEGTQTVWPSQEMNLGEKRKTLFQLNDCAAMHSVKIGNAIRTIDTWYGDTMLVKVNKVQESMLVGEDRPPIAIEPYGSVTQHGRAYRHATTDLYTLMKNWVNESETTDRGERLTENEKKYVLGNLIRGGVFGGDSE